MGVQSAGEVCYVRLTLMYCGQTVGRIKMPLGTEVDLGLGDIVLDGDPATPRKRAQHPRLLFSLLCSGTVAHLSNC